MARRALRAAGGDRLLLAWGSCRTTAKLSSLMLLIAPEVGMRGFFLGLSVAVAFIVGCVAGASGLVVPICGQVLHKKNAGEAFASPAL